MFGVGATVNIGKKGEVIYLGHNSAFDVTKASQAIRPRHIRTPPRRSTTPRRASNLAEPKGLRTVKAASGKDRGETVLSGAGISASPIPARLGWQVTPATGCVSRGRSSIDDAADAHLWEAAVDAETGRAAGRRRTAPSTTRWRILGARSHALMGPATRQLACRSSRRTR